MATYEATGRASQANKARRKARTLGAMGIGQAQAGFDEAKGYWKPQYEYGQNVLQDFQSWGKDGDITSDPSYKWRRGQGQEAVEQSAASRGGALSGNALRAVTDYGQQAASQEYQNEYNRWMQKLGMGERATGALSGLSAQGGLAVGGMTAGLGQQNFQNLLAGQASSREDVKAQNEIIGDWFDRIMGGGGGGGMMGGSGGGMGGGGGG